MGRGRMGDSKEGTPRQWTALLNSDTWQCRSGEESVEELLRVPICLSAFCQQLSFQRLLTALPSLSRKEWFLHKRLSMTAERGRACGATRGHVGDQSGT